MPLSGGFDLRSYILLEHTALLAITYHLWVFQSVLMGTFSRTGVNGQWNATAFCSDIGRISWPDLQKPLIWKAVRLSALHGVWIRALSLPREHVEDPKQYASVAVHVQLDVVVTKGIIDLEVELLSCLEKQIKGHNKRLFFERFWKWRASRTCRTNVSYANLYILWPVSNLLTLEAQLAHRRYLWALRERPTRYTLNGDSQNRVSTFR
jgi:hypothetical protein